MTKRCSRSAAAATNQSTALFARDQRAGRFPVRFQRDAADRAPAPAADRRVAPRRLPARDRDRGAAVRRDRARRARLRARARARRGALDPPLPLQPRYLSSAFAVGSQRVVSAQSVAVAVAGGMLAAIVAVLSPLREILSRDPLAAVAPRRAHRRGRGAPGRLALGGLACLAAATAILLAAPETAILGMVLPRRRAAAAAAAARSRRRSRWCARSRRGSSAPCRMSP